MQLATISLCMIIKDEELSIARALDSINGLVDEIIIVDTGSTDQSKQIASRYTGQVIDYQWHDDFSAARNFAYSHATQDFILWMDADDLLPEKNRVAFRELKEQLSDKIDAVSMPYHLSFDEHGHVTYMSRRTRLVKRSNNFRWVGRLHELLVVNGTIINSDIAFEHRKLKSRDPDRNLRIFEKMRCEGMQFSPRDLFYFANELRDHQRYQEAVLQYNLFLDTKQGWVEDNITACNRLAGCYQQLKQTDQEMAALLRALSYDTPRAETCCHLGYRFLQKSNIPASIFWYEAALQVKSPSNSWAITNLACSTWLPHLQLCVCYDRLGQYELANKHNELALLFNPSHPSMIHNRQYLASKLGK